MIYWDNNATTPLAPEVLEAMLPYLRENFYNPSAAYAAGKAVRKAIDHAREQVAALVGADASEIIFTSGGTESNNMALIGAALANKRSGMHIITTAFEHPSVYEPMFFLEELGFRVTYLSPGPEGCVTVEALKEALSTDTILVSVMAVNNEVGAVQDITALGAAVKAYNPAILFHVDAIQAYGKFRIYPKRQNIDMLSVSAHKLHGPKGCGFLYVKEKTKIKPILHGGGQQKGMRSGTENVPGIAGTGLAAELAASKIEALQEHLFELKKYFAEGLSKLSDVTIHLVDNEDGTPVSPEEREARLKRTAPHIMSVGFLGVRSEVLLHALEEKGIYVSSGSACSSNHPAVSGTLKAIDVKKELLDATVRFSFCKDTTKEELLYTLSVLKELLPQLRRFWRK